MTLQRELVDSNKVDKVMNNGNLLMLELHQRSHLEYQLMKLQIHPS